MSANVETMFYTREKPWHGLGVQVQEAPTSEKALWLAGLDWKVLQKDIFTEGRVRVPGYRANVRDTDGQVLGVVTDRYKVIQNEEAFAFTDALLGKGVRYETAGSLQDGRKVWLLARLPSEYIISGEQISPYLVFSNTHDGSGAVRVAVTPVRVVCNNTLNLALQTAKRSWSMIHTGDIKGKLQEAKDTLFLAEKYIIQFHLKPENGQIEQMHDEEKQRSDNRAQQHDDKPQQIGSSVVMQPLGLPFPLSVADRNQDEYTDQQIQNCYDHINDNNDAKDKLIPCQGHN